LASVKVIQKILLTEILNLQHYLLQISSLAYTMHYFDVLLQTAKILYFDVYMTHKNTATFM